MIETERFFYVDLSKLSKEQVEDFKAEVKYIDVYLGEGTHVICVLIKTVDLSNVYNKLKTKYKDSYPFVSPNLTMVTSDFINYQSQTVQQDFDEKYKFSYVKTG